MVPLWGQIALAVLALLVVYQSACMYFGARKAKKQQELFRILAENAADMIALVDLKGRRIYNSPAYKKILGYSAAELGETSSFEQIHPEDRYKVLEAAREARTSGTGRKLEYRIRHKDGSWRVLESLASGIRNEKGEVTRLVIVNRDVTERKRAQEQLEHNSLHDPLTGLANRRLFLDRLQHSFDRARRTPERQHAVLVVDIDNFKQLNEHLGFAAGDRILGEIAQRFETCLRDMDTISRPHDELSARATALSRSGGDEFTILLDGVEEPSDAMRVGERILAVLGHPILVGGESIRLFASIGISLSTAAQQKAEDPLEEADTAMRRARALGGNRCEVFNETMHSRAASRLRLESELKEAMAKRQFRILYQPMLRLKTGQIAGFEALLRWQHPQKGLISPYEFMAAAENAGLLGEAGQWLIREACHQLHAWTAGSPGTGQIAVSANLSARQLADAGFVNEIERSLRETGIEPTRLRLEFTEDVAAADLKLTEEILSNLRQLRVGVILDDFGRGNSSLIRLREWPVEAIKIDGSLIKRMLSDRRAADIVELIVMIGQKLKLTVVAEGVESAKQAEHLRSLGCDLAQGYYFSPPLEAVEAERFLRNGLHSRAKLAGAAE